MKKHLISALVALVACCVGAGSVQAQSVAIIDLKKVFDQHQRFQVNYEQMKKEVDAAEQDMKSREEAIKNLANKLRNYKIDSPEYKQLDDQVTKMRADYSVLLSQHKKNFARKEASIYNAAYLEIMQHVEYFCTQNKIDLVLRFNSDLMGEKDGGGDPAMVAKQLNKPVVYANMRIDITDIIVKACNRTPVTSGNTGRPGVPSIPPRK